MKTNYQEPIEILKNRIQELIIKLKDNQNEILLSEKKNLDFAIKWLEKGEKYNINPNNKIIKLPDTETKTPSSEYRIIEDHESDNCENWNELKIDQNFIRPIPGSWLISNDK